MTVMGRRTGVVTAGLAVLLLVGAATVQAAEARVIVDDDAVAVDHGALVAVVDEAEADGLILTVAARTSTPAGGAEREADRLVDQNGGAALVVTLEELAGVSEDHRDRHVDAALDAAFDALDDGVARAAAAFAASLQEADDGALAGLTDRVPWPMLVVIGLGLLSVVVRGAFGGGLGRRGIHRSRPRNRARHRAGTAWGTGGVGRGSASRSRSRGRGRASRRR